MDKHGANPDRILTQLTEHGLTPADWGGETEVCKISAKTGDGIDDLLETVLLTAEMLELKANPNRAGKGCVLEARLDKTRGPIATLLSRTVRSIRETSSLQALPWVASVS